MITKSVAFTLFRNWLNGRKKLRVDASFAHARISVTCTVDLISGDTICLRLADSGFMEIILTSPFHFELVQPKSSRAGFSGQSGNSHASQNTDYESAIIAFYGENTVTFMQLIESPDSLPK